MSVQADRGIWPTEELPQSWSWVSFGDFWEDHTDSSRKLPRSMYLPIGRYAVVDQGDVLIGGYSDDDNLKSKCPSPAIIFGDHTRAIKWIDVPFVQGADDVKVLRPRNLIDPLFGFWALRAVKLPDKGYSRHFKFLSSTPFPVAPLAEQRRIVAKLDALTARTARARADLDRVPALAARYRHAVLAAAFSGELTSSWRETHRQAEPRPVKLADLTCAPIRNGLSVKGSDTPPGVPALRLSALRGGVVNMSDVRYLPISGQHASRFLLLKGDVLVSRGNGTRAFVGMAAHVPDVPEPTIFPDTAFRIRLSPTVARTPWFTSIWNAPQTRAQIEDVAKTTAGIWKVSQGDLAAIELTLPSLDEQDEIVARLETAFAEIDRLAAEAAAARRLLDRLDQAILAKAFRGELVPQDPDDEPAAVLLARIKADRAGAAKPRRGRKAG